MQRVIGRLVVLAVSSMCFSVWAEQFTIERFVDSPSLNGPSIAGLKLAPDGSRATYLKGKHDNHLQQDLWAYDIKSDSHLLLVDSQTLVAGEEQLSEVERARRERMRIKGKGIVEYYWSPRGDALLFPLAGDLYYLALDSESGKATGKVRRLTATAAFETDVRFSPKGNYVSFVREQNLYIIKLNGGRERAMTRDGGGDISYATAEFVAQEEMGRVTGYWWSPDESRIALTRIDESGVKLVNRYEVDGEGAVAVIPQRYPFAGTDNVAIQLGVVKLSSRKNKINWLDLGDDSDIYLGRVDWLPDSKTVSFQRQNRAQTRLDLMFADVDSGKARTVLTETSPVWINLHDDLRFLDEDEQFVWASERSGYKHLYLMNYQGEVVAPLTSGEWAVDHLIGIDQAEGTVYFTANADGVLERHLYAVPLSGAENASMRRLTRDSGWHSIKYGCIKEGFQCSEALFIDSYSSAGEPPKVALRGEDGSLITWLVENNLDQSHPYYPYLDGDVALEFGILPAEDGRQLHYQIQKPAHMEPGKKYPAVVHLYGGPHSQLVKNAWNSRWFNQFLVRNGYVVFTIDNRGTYNRGIEFEGVIKGNLGEAEVADQVAGVEHLRTLDFVDSKRVGVYGWSYGGYMTLMSLLRAPDYFAAGASVAPVTDWMLYDTHYTERYMGVPEKAEDYRHASVFPYIDNYMNSDSKGKLLLVHGMADDNVFFDNSVKLMSALQNNRIDFQMMAYPGKRHGIRGADTRAHLWRMLFNFFEAELKK